MRLVCDDNGGAKSVIVTPPPPPIPPLSNTVFGKKMTCTTGPLKGINTRRMNELCIYIALYCVLLYTQSALQSRGGGLSSRKMHVAVLSLAVISLGNYIILYIIADIGEPLLCRALKLLLNAF